MSAPLGGFETITLRRDDGGSLSKRLSLQSNGAVKSDASLCRMTTGEAWRVHHAGLAAFAGHLDSRPSNEALALGALVAGAPDRISVVTKAALNGNAQPGVIARSQDFITFRPGTPAPLLLDHDTGGMPPEVRAEIVRLGGFWPTLVTVAPNLAGAARVIRASTSAGLSRDDTGAVFRRSGLHVYCRWKTGLTSRASCADCTMLAGSQGLAGSRRPKTASRLSRPSSTRWLATPRVWSSRAHHRSFIRWCRLRAGPNTSMAARSTPCCCRRSV